MHGKKLVVIGPLPILRGPFYIPFLESNFSTFFFLNLTVLIGIYLPFELCQLLETTCLIYTCFYFFLFQQHLSAKKGGAVKT